MGTSHRNSAARGTSLTRRSPPVGPGAAPRPAPARARSRRRTPACAAPCRTGPTPAASGGASASGRRRAPASGPTVRRRRARRSRPRGRRTGGGTGSAPASSSRPSESASAAASVARPSWCRHIARTATQGPGSRSAHRVAWPESSWAYDSQDGGDRIDRAAGPGGPDLAQRDVVPARPDGQRHERVPEARGERIERQRAACLRQRRVGGAARGRAPRRTPWRRRPSWASASARAARRPAPSPPG